MSSVEVTILNNGTEMNPEYNIFSIDIVKEVNKIPTAELSLLDGEAAKQEFKISNADFFAPGQEIEIKLRYQGEIKEQATVFKGLIVKHGVKDNRQFSLLNLYLKDPAIKLTTQRKSVVYRNLTDKEIIKQIIEAKDLTVGAIAPTQPKHKEMVQFYCTDWDFILSRADVNGYWVMVDDGQISVKLPQIEDNPQHTFEYGISDIYEFEIEADIRHQYQVIQSSAWDIRTQKLSTPRTANEFSLAQGNSNMRQLAEAIGAEEYQLIHGGQLEQDEIQAWADAKNIKSRLSLFRGRIEIPGLADIKPGDVIEVAGINKRFNGKTIVTAIRHQINSSGWVTYVQFGLSADWFSQSSEIIDTPAAGLVPAINGLQIGIVDNYEQDPQKQFRVKVKIPTLDAGKSTVWARLASLDAGNERGIFFRPEKGDEVILGFINDDPRQAIILGSLHSSKNPPPLSVTEENDEKGIVTKENIKFLFDDRDKLVKIETPKGNSIVMNDKDGLIEIVDKNNNKIAMNSEGVQISSNKDMEIEAKGNITIKGKKVDVN
ncbi:MAG: type VI secretion system tip protein VgrG [Prochloraceae cyanobacterium]|nr:type VI secretion system tip protein VgrG [Prochloraceae cyanobacterium]